MADLDKLDRFTRDYPAGTLLFQEGDESNEMYIVQRGEVELVKNSPTHPRLLAVVPAGEFLGEMGLINGRPRAATARVRKDARLLVIDGDTFEAMVRSKAEIAIRMITTMSWRLERANNQVELLLLKDTNHRVVQCLRQLATEEDAAPTDGDGIHIPITVDELAVRVTLPATEVSDILQRLAMARLIVHASEAGLDDIGFVIPELGKLYEFLQFLELKERYGSGQAEP